ncbi:esterase/lipase family protein [Ramlibacter humi]|uniref:Alpha/beta hydrolase n=1 Tax=Ramlibacter humi TaxID=2530451 RepID=A0A4Z0BGB0_9BURK|nr:alpha/beta hydrolase [Ramlibacter humi]TFY98342.1 alpha/beta hydrolase [Ramlibacter humi]
MAASSPPHRSRSPGRAAAAVRDARGGVRLLFDVMRHGLDRAEKLHEKLGQVDPAPAGGAMPRPARTITRAAYRVLRGGTNMAGSALDLVLASLQASLLQPQLERAPAAPSPGREAVVDAINALAGDHLHRTDNPLAVRTRLRVHDPASPKARVIVLVHDLGLGEAWRRRGHDHGEALAAALDATAIYVHYNSGRRVADVAHELSAELEPMLSHWRVPLQGVALIGHGQGGLVLRSALHQATRSGLAWPGHVRQVVFLGTPHDGAKPAGTWQLLSRLGAGPAAAVLPLAQLARRRSDGIDDFLHGRVLEDDARTGMTPMANAIAGVPASLPTYAIAAELPGTGSDGLVTVASALGKHAEPARDLMLPEEHRWVASGVDHVGLLGSDAVYQRMRQWLSV